MADPKLTIVEESQLQAFLGLKGAVGRWITRRIHHMLDLDRLNATQAKLPGLTGASFAAGVLKEVGVKWELPEEQLARIPAEGAFITVSNHHYGSIDGLILAATVGAVRPDLKILTTFMLTMIPGLKDTFIPVDNFASGATRSISGLRKALSHMAEGGPLALFPAGEVATWQRGKNRTSLKRGRVVEDIPWAENISKLIQRSGLPVVPIFFDGGNSKAFHILGRIHPRLRTIRLVHEMFNKPGQTVKVRIGAPIPAAEIAKMEIPVLGRYLRNRVYALEYQCAEPVKAASSALRQEPLVEAVPRERICAELDALKDRILFRAGDYCAYMIRSQEAPDTMRELYRLREETFRAVGEGTGLALDTDRYDEMYSQLILWNDAAKEIIGAYRVGYCDDLMKAEPGYGGIYTATLFKYAPEAAKILSQSMELGRSFVVPKYQKEVQPLKMLLAGLSVAAERHPGTAYCVGPVSISNDVPPFLRSLTVHFLLRDYKFKDASIVQPTCPFRPDFLRVNPDQLLESIAPGDIDAFDRLIAALSDGQFRLPVLVRKYFSCQARICCFNVDPLFSYSLDGLIFLRLADFPPVTLKALMRGMPEDLQAKVLAHFYGKEA